MTSLRHVLSSRFVVASLVALGASTTFAAVALARAVVIEPLPTVEREPTLRFATLQGSPRMPLDVIEGAAAAAPFSPTRQPSGPALEAAAEPETAIALELVGTVVSQAKGSDGFILVSVNKEAAKMVRVGDAIAGHRLRSISQASAVFTRIVDGMRVELHVPRSR